MPPTAAASTNLPKVILNSDHLIEARFERGNLKMLVNEMVQRQQAGRNAHSILPPPLIIGAQRVEFLINKQ